MPAFMTTILLVAVLLGCSNSVTIVSSPPKAMVSVIEPGKEVPKAIGETPITIDTDEIEDAVDTGTIVFILSKKGFTSQRFVVPNLSGADLKIESYLESNLDSNYKQFNEIIAMILHSEKLLIEERYDECLKSVEKIKAINPNISAAHQLEGSAYFMKKDLKKSRFAWLRAVQLEPENVDALAMLNLIEKTLGIQKDAK